MIDTVPSPHAVRWRTMTADEAQWVARTRDGLSTERKIAQLFNISTTDGDPEAVARAAALGLGAYQRFPGSDLTQAWDNSRRLITDAAIPPLISGDIEGGDVSFGFATPLPNQLGLAACNDLALSEQVMTVIARESRMLGFNWSFTPVVDINHAFRSTVVGTRSYGSNPETVAAQAQVAMRVLQAHGIAATAKHWPGEGFDDRDQHLLTTVNPLAMDQWHALFGRIYRELIDDGVMSVMIGHIALPAYGTDGDARSAYAPATLSHRLKHDLLRGDLGFEGLIVSDATVMGGMTSWMDRADAVPAVIESGCDMFLFSRDAPADMALMLDGLRTGALSEDRLESAVTKVLTLKALLGLHRLSPEERLPTLAEARETLRAPAHLAVGDAAAAASLTLVKDRQGLLPLTPTRHRRIVLLVDQDERVFLDGAPPRNFDVLTQALTAQGFDCRIYDADDQPTAADTDLLFYVVGRESTPVVGRAHIDWAALHGGMRKAMQRFRDIPALMVSFGHPYLLYDAPFVGTYVNAYTATAPVQHAIVNALIGLAAFDGHSPVDALCGHPEIALL